MKPHVLTINAMGPFAGTVDIDFDDVSQDGVFLIYGRTGAGKTSLLDALCFALYGDVPGARGVARLKSDHASASSTPLVSLEFTAQGNRYRVERSPRHERSKKRGLGMISVNPKANLVRLDRDDPTPLSIKPSEVTNEIVRLIGLTASQFKQVIMLPQGAFEEFLRAPADTKEILLETLFDTLLFERAEQWLAAESKRRAVSLSDARRGLTALANEAVGRSRDLEEDDRSGAHTTSGSEPESVDRSPAHLITGSEPESDEPSGDSASHGPERDGGEEGLDQEGLDRLVAHADTRLAQAQGATANSDLTVKRLEQERLAVRKLADQFTRYTKAVADQHSLDESQPAVEEATAQLQRATAADVVFPDLVTVRRLDAQLLAARERVDDARRIVITASRRTNGLMAFDLDTEPNPSKRTVDETRSTLVSRSKELAGLHDEETRAANAQSQADSDRRAAADQSDIEAEQRALAASAESRLTELDARIATGDEQSQRARAHCQVGRSFGQCRTRSRKKAH